MAKNNEHKSRIVNTEKLQKALVNSMDRSAGLQKIQMQASKIQNLYAKLESTKEQSSPQSEKK